MRFINPLQQRLNLIRYIGDRVTNEGRPVELTLESIADLNGNANRNMSFQLLSELEDRGEIIIGHKIMGGKYIDTNLSLVGWEIYESQKHGRLTSDFGFIAMQFNDIELETFVRDTVKPLVKESTGYNLIDVREVSRAGIIDNIIRSEIRNARFVIVDLTHDNNGAYWEAGYAEGLGKPVIYLCEKTKFETKRTHFDTNHCTTILWSKDDIDGFSSQFQATLVLSIQDSE